MSEQFNKDDERKGSLYITFNSYLDRLRAEQGQFPPQRRKSVPTIRELALDVGVHEVTLTNIVNGNLKLLNLEMSRKLLDAMWRRGFAPQTIDLVKYDPPE